MTRSGSVDETCEACGRSVAERFPGELPPAFCEACEDEFRLCLRTGHVVMALSGEVVMPG